MKAKDAKDALRNRCRPPEWALFFEVADSTGLAGHGRYLDAVAMNLFPSRGLELHGFEVKVSRVDLLRELKDPAKSEAVAQHCDRFWLVAPKDVVRDAGELPVGWGWLRLGADLSLRAAKRAPVLPGRSAAGPVERQFVAALLRRAAEAMARTPDKVAVEEALEEGRRQEREVRASNRDYELERAREAFNRSEARKKELEGLLAAHGWDSQEELRRRMVVARDIDVRGLSARLRDVLSMLDELSDP